MDKSDKKIIIRRLKILEGQIRGLQRMVDKEVYCVNILHQSAAIKKALASFEDLILENHLNTHVISQIKSGKSKKAVKEILMIYKLLKEKQ